MHKSVKFRLATAERGCVVEQQLDHGGCDLLSCRRLFDHKERLGAQLINYSFRGVDEGFPFWGLGSI